MSPNRALTFAIILCGSDNTYTTIFTPPNGPGESHVIHLQNLARRSFWSCLLQATASANARPPARDLGRARCAEVQRRPPMCGALDVVTFVARAVS